MSQIQHLRIHGDNILECESALKLLASALNKKKTSITFGGGSAFAPTYLVNSDTKEQFSIQLFPGYKRWGFELEKYIASLGAPLREMPDAIITKLTKEGDDLIEKPLLALEFSGALPAGNNAWQRTGRALGLAYAGIPYLYFAELGGQELDSSRAVKAARFPNPLVPFAYAALGMNLKSISIPVYLKSASIHKNIIEIFKDCFGTTESVQIVRGILLQEDYQVARTEIERKTVKVLHVLAQQRKRADVLTGEEWEKLFKLPSGSEKIKWLIEKAMPWNKKTGVKTLTPSFKALLFNTIQRGAVAIGSKEMPICIIPAEMRDKFSIDIKKLYKNKVSNEFTNWLSQKTNPLVCVWINGFKPRGDDSRPDRGLVPLARMIFGFENIDLITMVYGPATPATWNQLSLDKMKLAKNNGLWEAIINLSDALLVDSSTSKDLKTIGFLIQKDKMDLKPITLPAASTIPQFGEHDVDSVLHLLFSNATKLGVYESLCNPPGGDWSGISILDSTKDIEYRWTSLPRVSGINSKRPDHIIQLSKNRGFIIIESKDTSRSLEENIGIRLIKYVKDLLTVAPVSFRKLREESWEEYTNDFTPNKDEMYSAAAVKFKDINDLRETMSRGGVDIMIGVDFSSKTDLTLLHIITNKKASLLKPLIKQLASRYKSTLKILEY